MGLKVGIVGLPNAGKSTIFNALTKSGIAADNYPFCTIDPNVGIVHGFAVVVAWPRPLVTHLDIYQARSSVHGGSRDG